MIKSRLSAFFAFLLVLICLLPILKTGLYTDDLFLFQTRNSLSEFRDKPFTETAHKEVESWKNSGRYAPVSLYLMEFVYKNFTTIISYKIYVLLMNLLAVISFLLLLKSFNAPKLIPLFLLFYAAEIQFRLQYHDAFSAFNGMYQLLAICIFGSIASYNYSVQRRSWGFYILSIALASIAMLTSEMGVCLIPLLLICAWFNHPNLRKSVFSIIPFAAILLVYMAYILKIRSEATWSYPGLSANLNWSDMFPVLEIQLFAALPFSNLFKQNQIPQLLSGQLVGTFNFLAIFLILITATALIFGSKRISMVSFRKGLIWIAILLWLFPACILMTSVKYQHELHWGQGYLPVFIQNFGVAVILAYLALLILNIGELWSKVVFNFIGLVVITALLSAFLFNSAIIKVRNYDLCIPADALYRSIKSGILNDCPSGSNIILTDDYFWRAPDIYRQIFQDTYKRNFSVFDAEEQKPGSNVKINPVNACFLLECAKGDTIYTRLYKLDCSSGNKIGLLRCDTVMHNLRLSELEKPILLPRE